MTYQAAEGEPAPVDELRTRVAEGWRVWQASARRFTGIAPLLPPLIKDVQAAERATRGKPAHRQVQAVAADLYFLLRTVCKRIGRPDRAVSPASSRISRSRAPRAPRAASTLDDRTVDTWRAVSSA